MQYKNTKTGAVLDSPCIVSGGDWVNAELEDEQQEEAGNIENGEKESREIKVETKDDEDDEDDGTVDLSKMTIAGLKEFAAENGVGLGNATKKEDIIKIIVESDAVEIE